MWKCRNCQADNDNADKYCAQCDTPSLKYLTEDREAKKFKEKFYSIAMLLRASPIFVLVLVLIGLVIETLFY